MDGTDAWMKSPNCPKLVSECWKKSFDREMERRTSRMNVGTHPRSEGQDMGNSVGQSKGCERTAKQHYFGVS
jgi:hypothetical protein